jgi:RNA polymerase sigma factor (sigma-70 family)
MREEKELVKSCLKNDAEAQKEFYYRYAPKMFGICFRFSKNQMEAEDIMQEAFIRAYSKLRSFKFQGSLEGWVRKIIVNTSINYIKKNKVYFSEINIEDVAEEKFEIVKDEALSRLGEEEIINLIQELPAGKQLVFNLYIYEGLSHKEIAKKLNISINTSKSQLAKAKKMLQEKLQSLQQVS